MKNILLVEDDKFIIDIYTRKLKKAGFSVEIARDGEEALRKVKSIKPDLLILDIVLPNIDGWEIIKRIKKDKKLKDLKIVALTNLQRGEDIERGKSLGITGYFVKAHYTPSQIVEEIKNVMSQSPDRTNDSGTS